MYNFLEQNQLYVVLIVVLIIWLGFVILLFRIDKKLQVLEKIIEKKQNNFV